MKKLRIIFILFFVLYKGELIRDVLINIGKLSLSLQIGLNKVLIRVSESLATYSMIKTDLNHARSTPFQPSQGETSPFQLINNPISHILHRHQFNEPQIQKPGISNNLVSLNSKEQVQSVNSQQNVSSDEMDIDEQNDIVNELSFMQDIDKADEQDEMFANLSAKDRLLYANTKKHQGNQHFKQNNLQEAIESYKFGLSLLKPQSFALSTPRDCLLMAELTSNILYNMGTCYFILMSYRYAIRFYDQAILIKPNYAKAIHNRALSHLEEGNLLQSYNDIKLALSYDSQNGSVLADFQKIQDEYLKVYGHQTLKRHPSPFQLQEKRLMSKSMIENTLSISELLVEKSDYTPTSTINKQNTFVNNVEITKLAEDKLADTKSFLQPSINPTKQPIKSFYGKRFYRNQVSGTPKFIKPLNSSMKSPKFRPYILNKTLNSVNNLTKNLEVKKTNKQSLQNSGGQHLEREQKINLLKQKIKPEPQQNPNSGKNKRKQSRYKQIVDGKGDYWGYIPIFVATGYGIYHSLRAVLGN